MKSAGADRSYYDSWSGHGFDDNMRTDIFAVGPER